jgi:pyruvate dehydrogenase E2 component (dihydrolipoamide acetyltransferase)
MQKSSNSGDRKFVSPIAADRGVDIDAIIGTGPNNRIILADVEEALKAGPVKVAKDVEVKKVPA